MKLRKISILNVFGFLLLLITTLVLVITLDTKNIYGLDNIKSSSYDSTLLFVNKIYNIIAAGDWYCNEETEKTIQNVLNANPDLIITTGDHVKDVKSADCWIDM